MRRILLIKLTRAVIPLMRFAIELLRAQAEETPNRLDDLLAEGLIQSLKIIEEILKTS